MHIEPMLCELADPASLDELAKGDWILERKYDGERIIGQWNKGRVDLWTRRALNVAKKFPEIVSAMGALKGHGHTVVDGELVVGKDLEDLAMRQTEERLAIHILSTKMPARFVVFDVLILDGKEVMNKPLAQRRELLEGLFAYGSDSIVLCPTYPPNEAKNMFEKFVAEGYEGLVAKRLSGKYVPGKRSNDWLKFKRIETVDVEIIGARMSDAGIPFASLIMMRNGKYFGCVGSGFTSAERIRILAMLRKNAVSKAQVEIPDDVVPIVLNKPLPAEIKVNAILADGSPRAPVWVRFRL